MLTNKPIQFSHRIWFCSPIRGMKIHNFTQAKEKNR